MKRNRITYTKDLRQWVLELDNLGNFVAQYATEEPVTYQSTVVDMSSFFEIDPDKEQDATYQKYQAQFQTEFARLQRRHAAPVEYYKLFDNFGSWAAAYEPLQEGIDAQPLDPNHVMGRFADPDVDCFFDGCTELRKQMEVEIAAAGGPDCKGCARNTIVSQFGQKALAAWTEQNSPDK